MNTQGQNHSEAWRHETKARQVATWGRTDPAKAKRHLANVAERRGEAAARRLREDAAAMWRQQEKAA